MTTSLNTLKSVLGYLQSLGEKYTGVSLKGRSINSIYNFLQLDHRLFTSGQPTMNQFASIYDTGAKVVINLAPSSAENALTDEAIIVESFGMKYIHLPVDFKAPSEGDYASFVELMSQYRDEIVWIHCAANMRVSAFLYRYRRHQLGLSDEIAVLDLERIWEPFGIWKKFIAKTDVYSTN